MKSKKLLSFAVLPCLIANAYAASDNVFTLGEVRVTASADNASTIGSTSIDLDEMRAHDRTNVATALNMVPGVNFTKGGARNEQMLAVRGFDLRQVPIYADGIPIYVPYDGYVDLARFTTFDLSKIEISKGFSSALYGANTLGGAINLVSRRPTKDFEGEVGGGFSFGDKGGVGGQQFYTNVGTNKGMWYLQAGVSQSSQDFYNLPNGFKTATEDGGKRDQSYQRDSKVNVKIGLTPNETDEYAFSYIKQEGVKGTPPYTGVVSSPRNWRWPVWDKESFYFLSKTQFNNHTLKFRAYHDTFKNSLLQYTNNTFTTLSTGTSAPSYYNDFTNGYSVEDDIQLSDANLLKIAYNYKLDIHRENLINLPVTQNKDETRSLAIEDTHIVNQRLTIAGGVSFETRRGLVEETASGSTVTALPPSSTSATNGQFAANYKLTDNDTIRVSAARKSRFPTIKDRYSTGMGVNLRNPDLQTEYANHYEVGYQTKLNKDWVLNSSLFRSNITNMIQSAAITNTVTQKQNIGKVVVDGLELELNGALRNLDVGGNYTYMNRSNRANGDFLTDTPRNKLFTYATLNLGGGWKVNGSIESSSRRYSSSNGTQVAPGFTVANTKASYTLPNGMLIEAGIRNIFDTVYMYSEGFPEAGRTYFTQFNMPL